MKTFILRILFGGFLLSSISSDSLDQVVFAFNHGYVFQKEIFVDPDDNTLQYFIVVQDRICPRKTLIFISVLKTDYDYTCLGDQVWLDRALVNRH